jgi:HD-GYP domain-containing protein (c-di-GMP phosphodiesterase class II)
MCLAAHIITRFSVLLPHGHRLSENDINSLRRKFPDLMVQIRDPILDDTVKFDDDTEAQMVSLKVRKNVAGITAKVSSLVRAGVALDAEHISGMESVIQQMLEYLQANPVTTAFIEQSASWNDYLQEHGANVFYLSLLVGNTVRNYIKQERERLTATKAVRHSMDLTSLATGAIFHDIGMVPIEHVYQKTEPLTPAEREAIKAHPHVGAAMLPEAIDPVARQVVRQHHENQEGSGYPDGLPGNQISIFARIVRVADAYTAAISSKVYQKAKSPVKALYEIVHGPQRGLYDSVILKVFASLVQPFPIGARLKLTNGQWAVVVQHNRRDPFRPEIIIAFDELGDPLPREKLKPPFPYGERPEVQFHSFAGEDLSYLPAVATDTAFTEHDHRLARDYAELFDFAYP